MGAVWIYFIIERYKIRNPGLRRGVQILKTGLYWCYDILLMLHPTDLDVFTDTSFPVLTSLIASFK
jgi:hypothetical protein